MPRSFKPKFLAKRESLKEPSGQRAINEHPEEGIRTNNISGPLTGTGAINKSRNLWEQRTYEIINRRKWQFANEKKRRQY
jgi:hypothetical protein